MTSEPFRSKMSSLFDDRSITQEDASEDAAALAALQRMGSGQPGKRPDAGHKPAMSPRMPLQQVRSPHQHDNNSMQNRKPRRFARDGEVQVEHAQLTRNTLRSAPQAENAGENLQNLRRQLDNERRLRMNAEREIQDLTTAHKTLETHLAHASLENTDLKQKLKNLETIILQQKVKISDLEEASHERNLSFRKLEQSLHDLQSERLRKYELAEDKTVQDDDEPQPVKWWKD